MEDRAQLIETLRKVRCLTDLDDKELHLLLDQMQRLEFGEGDVLCREGEKGDRMFVIESGGVSVFKAGDGCRLLAYDKYPNSELADKFDVEYVELARLLAESDIVSLHAPLLAETHHLIDADAIDKMKTGVMLINTSRGGLVDTTALLEGLKNRKIGQSSAGRAR